MIDLASALASLYPDTRIAWLPRAQRVIVLRDWMRQIVRWMRDAGAEDEEVEGALRGCVAWVEAERHERGRR
jgi:hypothetical protein